ncbi:hypothetical protein HA402_012363 [Bradysia odoriphaga]|nr:hypothetical protein HA402_012363 [Bradysia odoriphaga]
MNSVTKLRCGLFVLMMTISGAYSLDVWLDPRLEHKWNETCLNGRLQSPIAITKCGRTRLSHIHLEYKNFEIPIGQITVVNGARQTVYEWNRKEVERSVIVWAPADRVAPFKANTEYILQNIHVHHGRNSRTGTLHSIDGEFFAMEMHLLFVTREFDGNTAPAFAQLGNVLEIVVLFRSSNVRNYAWSQINNLMLSKKLKESEKITGNVNIRFSDFLPRNSRYVLYHGSVPASHCAESVTWIIYENTMDFDTDDLGMRYFTYISEGEEIPVERNTRAIQSQNGRPVFEGYQEKVGHYKR